MDFWKTNSNILPSTRRINLKRGPIPLEGLISNCDTMNKKSGLEEYFAN